MTKPIPIATSLLCLLLASGALLSQTSGRPDARLNVVDLGGGQRVASILRSGAGLGSGDGVGGFANGGFDAGLNGWTTDIQPSTAMGAAVQVVGGRGELREGGAFLTSLSQRILIPAGATTLSFEVFETPGFERLAGGIPDAFEVSILDDSFQSGAPTWSPFVTSFFNLQEDGSVNLGPGAQWDGTRAVLDISYLPAATEWTIFVDLIGADADQGSGIQVDNFRLQVPPRFQPPSPCGQSLGASVGVPIQIQIVADDLDPLDTVTISATTLPPGAIWNAGSNPAGNPAIGTLEWPSPTAGFHSVGFVVVDEFGASESCSFFIVGTQDAPTFDAPTPCGATLPGQVGQTLTFDVLASDPNLTDVVTLTVDALPAGANFTTALPATGNPVSTTFNWVPGLGDAGMHTLNFTADDGNGNTANCAVTIDIAASNPPLFDASSMCGATLMTTAGVTRRLTVTARDLDPGDLVTLSAISLPAGATFTPSGPNPDNPVSGVFEWTPGPTQIGSFSAAFEARDRLGQASTCQVQFDVAECYLLLTDQIATQPGLFGLPWLRIDPYTAFVYPVTLTDIPNFAVPADPTIRGMVFHLQVVMWNPHYFPSNPMQYTTVLQVPIGGLPTHTGPRNGMDIWAPSAAQVGHPFSISFSIDGL